MLLYIGIAVFIILGSISKQSKYIYYLSLIILFFITAFRNPDLGGFDTLIYQDFFEMTPAFTELWGYESKYTIGYTVLNSIVKQFSNNFIAYQFVYTLITIVLINIILKNLELSYKEKCLFLFSYFCFRYTWNTWVLLRQNMANLFFWLFLILLFKRIAILKNEGEKIWNKETVLLLTGAILVPTSFHTSGIVNICLLMVFFMLERVSVKHKILLIPVGTIAIYFVGSRIYPILYRIVINFIDSRYAYFGETIHTDSNLFETVFRLAFFFVYAWHYEKEKSPYKELILNSQGIIVLLGAMNVGTFDRMLEYYAIGLYLGMALILNIFKEKSKFVGLIFFGIGMIGLLCRFLLIMDDGQFLNYSLCFG